ncbi:MAG: TonB-dependent receptor plug domain-containing protein, partial [Nodosilinea sp.]
MDKYWIGAGAGLLGLLLSQPAYGLGDQERGAAEGGEETSLLVPQAPLLSEIEQPYATVDAWLTAQAESAIAITDIQLNPTATGVDIILSTQGQVAPTTSTLGNALIVEIPNAVLTSDRFERAEPAEGIALITAENLPDNRVRIAITGNDAPPAVAVRSGLQSLVVGITPGIAAADISDEEAINIVVTAQKTPEDSQDVPISLTVIPQQTLEDAQINDLTGISRNTPNFSFFPTNAGGSDFSYYSIRGLNNFNFLVSQDSVGYYIDDVPFDFGAFLDVGLLDLERVEVLRGPQSTLYGRSSPAGVVNIISRAPTNVSEFRVAGSYGNYNFRDAQLSYSNALIPDQLSFRLAGAYRARDGVFQNQTLERSVGQQEQLLGRAQLLWTPSEEWSVSFNTYVSDA